MAGVLVVGELANGSLASITGELLTAARKLAGPLGEPIGALLMADRAGNTAKEAGQAGAEVVYVVEDPLLKEPPVELVLSAVEQVVKKVQPTVVLLGRTPLGRDLGPRLAFRLGVGLVQDAVDLACDAQTKKVTANRPVYGGNAVAKVALNSRPHVITVRPKVFEATAPNPAPSPKVEAVPVKLDAAAAKIKVLKRTQQEAAGVKLEEARIVVGGGRGLGGPEPFKQLDELAKLLGGAVGASRAVCDAGWMPYAYQIGLTGKSITADTYIAIAISGASQHLTGISTVKNIIAVNKDAEANIFKEARFGVVGDWKKILPAFIQQVQELVK
ncbi:MAG: electron transfer flavoprotein subunit alpha/FixB family protein [Chloroflexi bacterium]|nr:electron transfer flavoprotein subunit alpha/FixB family protein [Chloroflexota bacterium]